jgi:acetyl-CoA synthetase
MSVSDNTGVIQSVSREVRVFPPPAAAAARALVDAETYEKMYRRSVDDPEGFWADMARAELTWSKPWDRVLDWKPPVARWFDGGELNVSVNCLGPAHHLPGAARRGVQVCQRPREAGGRGR